MFQVCLKLLTKHFYRGLKFINLNMLSWCWCLFSPFNLNCLALGIILIESWTFFFVLWDSRLYLNHLSVASWPSQTPLTGEAGAEPCDCQMQAKSRLSTQAMLPPETGCFSLLLGESWPRTWSPLTLCRDRGTHHYWLMGMKVQDLYLVICGPTPVGVLALQFILMRVKSRLPIL